MPAAHRSSAALIINNETVLLAKRMPGGDIGEKWELPGGKVKDGEEPVDALKREIREELCVDIDVGKLVYTGGFKHGGKHYQLYAYRCKIKKEPEELIEHSGWGWFDHQAALKLDLADSDRRVLENIDQEVISQD